MKVISKVLVAEKVMEVRQVFHPEDSPRPLAQVTK
jgi:hypothetical protein